MKTSWNNIKRLSGVKNKAESTRDTEAWVNKYPNTEHTCLKTQKKPPISSPRVALLAVNATVDKN